MSVDSDTSPLKLFLKQFVEDFFHMGAILPSSGALAQAGVAYLAQKEGPVSILEAGAGTGSFTQKIVPLLESGDELDIVEINPQLLAYLQQRFEQEAEFQIPPDVAVNFLCKDLRKIEPKQYDYIVFSLPLTNFPPEMVQEILDLMVERLKPGGVFSYVKYIFISRLKYLFSNAEVKLKMRTNQEIIQTFTHRYQIERRAIMFNVPPTWVYYWQKPVSDESKW